MFDEVVPVKMLTTHTTFSGNDGAGTGPLGLGKGNADSSANITTGLLPNYLPVSGKTRQNDLDVGSTISINPGAGSLAGNTTTLGRIGTGFMYADWKSQVAYSSPNWNGFSFTVGLTQAWDSNASAWTYDNPNALSGSRAGGKTAYEGKASYEWAGDVAGKVWVSAIQQDVDNIYDFTSANGVSDDDATAWDIGANVNVAGFGLTGYYGDGKGIGQTLQLLDRFSYDGKARDSDQWYVQATYTIPGAGTKLGVSYGESTLDGNSIDTFNEVEDSMWTVGACHPITKHLNLVAEYSESERDVSSNFADVDGKAKEKLFL